MRQMNPKTASEYFSSTFSWKQIPHSDSCMKSSPVKLLLKRHVEIKDDGMFSKLIDESEDAAKREDLALTAIYSIGHAVEIFWYLQEARKTKCPGNQRMGNEMINCIIQTSGCSNLVCLCKSRWHKCNGRQIYWCCGAFTFRVFSWVNLHTLHCSPY
uniref:Uncharacterized protein n=1 Tax=Lepeophtheirus salmonis TaxID=72036 RepID=A0A0K2TRY4_LEPSM